MSKRRFKNNRRKKTFTSSDLSLIVERVFCDQPSKVFSFSEICKTTSLIDKNSRRKVYDILSELQKTKTIRQESYNNFILNKPINKLSGRIFITNNGAGFVGNDLLKSDVFIAPNKTLNAMNGDLVEFKIIKRKNNRDEGLVVCILESERSHLVGRLEYKNNKPLIVPDNPKLGNKILLDQDKLNGAKKGDKVLVKLFPRDYSPVSKGVIEEVLARKNTNDTEMISILCYHGIKFKFPNEVQDQAERMSSNFSEDDLKNRRDLRDKITFTIDPDDAKDFDDAISYEKIDKTTTRIGVHIADVSHYVRPNTPMDNEAKKRGNSVYLVDRVVPMIPEQLSNVICSLRPHEEKLCFSVIFDINDQGEIIKEWLGKTIILSKHRFTYEDAQQVIENQKGQFSKEINYLDEIAKKYRKERLSAGALNIESEEVRFVLDKNGDPTGVKIKTSKDAHKLVEEFMLLANKTVAKFFKKSKADSLNQNMIYRVHDKPDESKIEQLKVYLDKFGIDLGKSDIHNLSKSLNSMLHGLKGKNEFNFLQSLVIRSMSKASYDVKNIGHYGLSFSDYTHFTSPIRRYADLVVHRLLQEKLTASKSNSNSDLIEVSKHISRTEKKASEAERDSVKFFQTIYLLDSIGEVFNGTVSGIAEHGLYVRMDDNYCEGMVAISEIPGDRYYFDFDKFCIVGAKTKKEFSFGQRVCVRIFEINPMRRHIDLELLLE
ncbi:MAG: ribonuclease R [Crocinitomicaceae bacterium]|nr:ribonuclease R [Crocinitomicaceae bacterium]